MRSAELAKGWLLALVEDVPLDEAAAILAGDVARDGPRICDAVVRAIADESDLRRIEPGGVLEPLASRVGELAGAHGAAAAAHAVATLKDVVWSGLRGEMSQEEPELLADAAERLSLVIELIRGAVLRREEQDNPVGGRTERVAPLRVASPPGGIERRAGVERSEDVDVVERREEPGPVGPTELRREGDRLPGLAGTQDSIGRAGSVAPGAKFEEGGQDPGRDALWVGALRDEIVRAARARVPLSLLLVELEEAERMLAVETPAHATATFGRFAQAVRGSVRRRDVLACETETRAWIIARDTGRTGAQALGLRIATTVPEEESWRGAPLTVSVGLAVLGEDGQNAAELIDTAEQTRFAAEASGLGIVGEAEDGEGGNGEDVWHPGDPGPEPPPSGGPGLAG